MEKQRYKIETMRIIPFYNAIQSGDRKMIDDEITQDEFEYLCIDFMELDDSDKTPIEKQKEQLKNKIAVVEVSIEFLKANLYDKEIAEMLLDHGIKITNEYFFDDIVEAEKKLAALKRKLNLLKTEKPLESNKKHNIYDILTSLSSGLEISLNFEPMTVSEFFSWQRTLENKIKNIKSRKNG